MKTPVSMLKATDDASHLVMVSLLLAKRGVPTSSILALMCAYARDKKAGLIK
jgi:hypothetical protein